MCGQQHIELDLFTIMHMNNATANKTSSTAAEPTNYHFVYRITEKKKPQTAYVQLLFFICFCTIIMTKLALHSTLYHVMQVLNLYL